jgi:hypothetical protein
METVLDHIVIVAPDLTSGAAYIFNTLGVELQQGGTHPRMATHNLLLRLDETSYLEVIAPCYSGPRPSRPRWFELDQMAPETQPHLRTWVVRTEDIESTRICCESLLGEVEHMSRGNLSWLITVPADGSLPMNGVAPSLIEWKSKPHPASTLKDMGCSLRNLDVFHPSPVLVKELLAGIRLTTKVNIHQIPKNTHPHLVAQIQTPLGLFTLD